MERAADPAHVPDEALVAVLLKTGAHGLNVIDLSRRLIEAFGSMKSLVTSDWRALESRIKVWNETHPDRTIKGVGHVKCLELAAAFEMGRRWMRLAPEEIRNHRVTSTAAAYEVFKTVFTPGDEDVDIRGIFVVPSGEYVRLTPTPKQVSDERNDITYYSLRRVVATSACGIRCRKSRQHRRITASWLKMLRVVLLR